MKTLLMKLVPGLVCGVLAVFLIAVPASQAQAQSTFTFNGFLTFSDGTNEHTVFMEDIVNQGQDVPFPCYDWQGDDSGNQGPEFHLSCSATLVGTFADVNFNQTHNQDHLFMQSVSDCETHSTDPFSGVIPFNDGEVVEIVDFFIDRDPGGTCEPGTFDPLPDIELLKQISIDGGFTWFDADDGASAPVAEIGSGAEYRLIVTNTGDVDLENVTINDAELGIVDVNIGTLLVGQSVTLTSGDIPELSVAERCTEGGLFENVAFVEGASTADGTLVNDNDPANLVCVGINVIKDGDAIAKVGEEVNYEFTLQNLSADELTDCTATDSVLGTIFGPSGTLPVGNTTVLESHTTSSDDAPVLENVVTLTCEVVGPVNSVTLVATDDHAADLIDPEITVTKSGPAVAKVGEEITYTIGFTASGFAESGDGSIGTCTGNDTVLGDLGVFEDGVNRTFNYSVQEGDPDPLVNTATITCGVVGFPNSASDSDGHSTDLIDPDIQVTKSGPAVAKVGEEITYTIGFTASGFAASGDGSIGTCTGNDTVLGDLGVFEDGVNQTFNHTVSESDPDPLVNTATITCDVVGFPNEASDSDSHSVDIFDPAVELSKECRPDPVLVGDTIHWAITVDNTGDTDLDCTVNDAEAGLVDEAVFVAAGDSVTLDASREVVGADFPSISNTASVECTLSGVDLPNVLNDAAEATCEVSEVLEICRTPGFWGTHAGTETRNSSNLTQTVIDSVTGSIEVCGATIDNTDVGNVHSAVEAMCVRIEGIVVRQLARQLTAMSLNCIVSGGEADCTGTSVEELFAECDALCAADEGGSGSGSTLGSCIDRVDCFNNGGIWDEVEEVCHIDDEDPANCQNRELDEATDIFDGISPFPGPAGSARACSSAIGNGVKVVPAS